MTRSETIPSNHFLSLTAGVQAVYDSTAQLKYYRHADWLGSSWLQLNTDGTLHGDRAYAPYGEPYGETTTTADRSFTGQTSDTVTDTSLNGTTELYDFLYRQYSPTQGRWLMPDPAGVAAVDLTPPPTWNRYTYAANNPLSNVDPAGLSPIHEEGGDDNCWEYGGAVPGYPCGLWDTLGADLFKRFICKVDGCDSDRGSGSNGSGGGNPPGSGGGGTPVTWPNETNGIPNGLNVNFGGVWGAILPSDANCDFGICIPIANGALDYVDPRDVPSCFGLFLSTVKSDLLPISPSWSSVVPAGVVLAQGVARNKALQYGATKGLLYPLRSSVYRGLIGRVGMLGEATIPLTVLVATGHGLFDELRAAQQGNCRADW